MSFFIQVSNPQIKHIRNEEDITLADAIESSFPLETENLIMYWNHIPVSLSYKYDIT